MTTKQEISKAFNTLQMFKTPLEIAQHLQSLGIKGMQGNTNRCAVSEYMRSKGAEYPATSYGQGWYYPSDEGERDIHYTWGPESALQQFIDNFDDYHYPDLIHEEDEYWDD